MGFMFTLIGLSVIVCLLVAICEHDEHNKGKASGGAAGAGFLCIIVIGVVFLVIKLISYANYLDMMEKQATIEQEVASIKLYAEKGVGVFFPGQVLGKEFTDLKFNAYQEEMSDKIFRLKSMVQSYNRHVVSKKLMKDNLYWDWWIYMPDMNITTISMDELLNPKREQIEPKPVVIFGGNGHTP